jgi:hypothetical protein
VPASDHRCDPFFTLLRVSSRCREWPDTPSLGKTKRGVDRSFVGMGSRLGLVDPIDPRPPQLVGEPSLAIAPRC